MSEHPFYIANVFAEEPYAGNHVAVVRKGHLLSDIEMQKIAKEIGPAAFILSDEQTQTHYPVRVFTPAREIFFCGHPVVGTASVIQKELVQQPVQTLVIKLPGADIPLDFQYKNGSLDTITMKQQAATFGQLFTLEEILAVLQGLEASDIEEHYPIQEVSTGLPYIVVPVKTLAALQRVSIAREPFWALIQDLPVKVILLFSTETYNPANQFHVRVFADYYGVPEDPATGSASGCLGAYLLQYQAKNSERIDLRVEQGHIMGRPSLLYLRAERNAGRIDTYVGGRVVVVAKGSLRANGETF